MQPCQTTLFNELNTTLGLDTFTGQPLSALSIRYGAHTRCKSLYIVKINMSARFYRALIGINRCFNIDMLTQIKA